MLHPSAKIGADVTNPTTEAVYLFVCRYLEIHKYAPTEREIADACYLAQSSVRLHLKKLIEQGRLCYTPGKRRTLSLPEA